MESPEDPMSYMPEQAQHMPSFWNWREVRDMAQRHEGLWTSMDEGGLGHERRKPTTILHNVGPLMKLFMNFEEVLKVRSFRRQQRNPFSSQGLGQGGLMAWWICWSWHSGPTWSPWWRKGMVFNVRVDLQPVREKTMPTSRRSALERWTPSFGGDTSSATTRWLTAPEAARELVGTRDVYRLGGAS